MSGASVIRFGARIFNHESVLTPELAREWLAQAGQVVTTQERETVLNVSNALLAELEQNLQVRIRSAHLTMTPGQARRALRTDPGLAIALGYRSPQEQRLVQRRCEAHSIIDTFLAAHPGASLPSLFAQSAGGGALTGAGVGFCAGGPWGAVIGGVAGLAAGIYAVSHGEAID